MNKTKSKEWYKGRADLKDDNSIYQINMECKYLHLEKLKDGHWMLGVVDVSNVNMFFHLKSKSNIDCELEDDDYKLQSFEFGEKK